MDTNPAALTEAMPRELICRVARQRVNENAVRAASRKTTK
jgi:hypothetical protein